MRRAAAPRKLTLKAASSYPMPAESLIQVKPAVPQAVIFSMAPHNFADTGADIRAIFLRLVQASREEEAMSRTTEFFQAVRERRHHRRCPEAHHRDVPSYGPAPVGRTERDDLDVWTNAFQPLGASGTQPDLRVDRMIQAFHINRRELEQDYPRVLRDAEITCGQCRSKRRCFRELEAGTAAANLENFCPNADLFLIFADDQDGSFRA